MSLSPSTFDYVSTLVRTRSAIQLGPGKEYLVESRLIPLAREAGLAGDDAVDAYVERLRRGADPAATTRVVEAMTTNETSWFRDATPFTELASTVLPQVRTANSGELRIWSAACSTGQEPYSIAMTLLDAGEQRFSVLASDLSGEVLEQARSGLYSQLETNRGLPAPMLVRYFSRAGAKWQVAEQLRRAVTFRQHNLLHPPPLGVGPFDVVFLRNVLIYFDAPTKQAILTRLRSVMRPGAYLVLGAAENTFGTGEAWERVRTSRGSLYRATGGRP